MLPVITTFEKVIENFYSSCLMQMWPVKKLWACKKNPVAFGRYKSECQYPKVNQEYLIEKLLSFHFPIKRPSNIN